MQAGDTWEDEDSASESSSVVDPSSVDIRRYHNPHYDGRDNESSPEASQLHDNSNNDYLSDGTSSPLSTRKKFVQSNASKNQNVLAEDTDDYCKEVQCIEMDEDSETLALTSSGNDGALALTVSGNTDVAGQVNSVDRDADLGRTQNGFAHDVLNQRINPLASPYPSSRSLSLTRSWSCRADLMTSPSSPDKAERTPSNGFEKGFPGRPEGLGRKFPLNFDSKSIRLSRNDSQSSFGSVSRVGDEDVTSLQTFMAGMKEMAKLEHEKQLVDGQVRIDIFDFSARFLCLIILGFVLQKSHLFGL